uniref:Tetratricopeptide repeat protein n=1 Tax=Strix occidentalis caurina TaxID=311401 RepID=A0A8D0FWP3_STROC
MELKKYELASLCIHQLAEVDEESFTSQPVQQALIQSFCQNHNKAIECFCEATATHPEPSMFVILGKIQMKAKKTKVIKFTLYICQARHIFFCILLIFYEIAWRQFTVAICIDPKCHAAYDRRTSVCLLMGETFAAFQDTNAAIKLTTTAPLLTNWGVINELIGYLPCAMKDYQQAISVDTNYALAYFNAANIYFHNRQFSQAYCYYSKVLQLDPRNESAVMNRAITNTLLNNIAEAKEDFEKSICLCPFSAAVYSLQQGKFIQWIEATLTTLSIQPNDALIYKFRADIHSKLGFNKEAVEDYKQAISFQEQIDSM